MAAVIATLLPGFSTAAQSQTESPLFSGITGMVQWVGELTRVLDKQVDEAKRRKLRRSLSGLAVHLARLEDSKRTINNLLLASHPDAAKLEANLEILREDLRSVGTDVSAIRSEVGQQLANEGAKLERELSNALAARQQTVEGMLRSLRLPAPGEPVNRAKLEEESRKLVELVQKAQDAVNELTEKLR